MEQKKIVIIGASSGIGKALAEEYCQQGWLVGITGRRNQLLEEIYTKFPSQIFTQAFDITIEGSEQFLFELCEKMGTIDLIVVNSGIGNKNLSNSIAPDLLTINTNVTGFTRMTMAAFQIFKRQGFGHLVGISSVAAHFGYGKAAAYNASKAFVSTFLSGIRHRAKLAKLDISITDCQPGFIETPLIATKSEVFGSISSEQFARLFFKKIQTNPNVMILPSRWKFAVWITKMIPDSLLQKLI